MEEVINSIKLLFQTYGFKASTIVVATILVVNLVKKPIVKYAEKYALKNDCDKSVITRYISVLPFITSFIISLLWELVIFNFNFSLVNFSSLLTDVLLYGSLSIATFETIKLQFEAYATKKEIKKQKEKETQNGNNNLTDKEEIKIENEIL